MEQLDLSAAQQVLQKAPIGILLLDSNNSIQWHNQTLLELLGLREEQLTGQSAATLSPDLRGALIDPPETILLQKGEQQRWVRSRRQASEKGGKVHFYIDISNEQRHRLERDKLAEELQQLTTRDPVTGLPNRRALQQGLDPLVSRSRRYGNPLSVIKLSIGLRGGNEDTRAEMMEEAWLRTGQALKDQMRWADIIGRWEQSDFLLVLPETPEDAARQLAEKICSLISDIELEDSEGHVLKLTPFCGISGWNKGDDATLLLQRAAEGVDAAKKADTPIAAIN